MWGQVNTYVIQVPVRGIIPTHVGTRRLFRMALDTEKDHPHACGDKFDFRDVH